MHDGEVVAGQGQQVKDGVLKLVLKPDLPIHVLVVGPKGRPARGVPVVLTHMLEYFTGRDEPVKTDGEGRAQIRLGIYRHHGSDEMYVRAKIASKEPVGQEFDPSGFKNDAQSPIKLTLPEYGMVRVYALGEDGKPLPGIDGATLRVLGSRNRQPEPIEADLVRGDSATFSVVEVGLKIEVGCTYQGDQRPQKMTSDGPRHHLDMRIINIEGVTAPGRLTLRLLGMDGKPVASEEVGVLFTGEDAWGTTVQTDAEGSLEVVVPNKYAKAADGKLRVLRRSRDSKPGQANLGAVEISLPSAGEPKDLGDVQLEQEDLLAAGQVVDRSGDPIPAAMVYVQEVGSRFSHNSTGGLPEFFQCLAVTDEDGQFELRAMGVDLPEIQLRILVQGYNVLSGDKIAVGTKDAKVVMDGTTSLHGRFKGMKGFSRFEGEIHLVGKAAKSRESFISIDEQGSFALDCVPDEYSVKFKLQGSEEPFLTIPGVKVEKGKPCKDPRMMNIDLAAHVSVVKVTVLGPDKKPVKAQVWTHVVRENGSTARGGHTGENGEILLMLPKDGGNVSVQGKSGKFRSQRFPLLTEDVVVQLEPAVPVKIQCSGMPELPTNMLFSVHVSSKIPLQRGPGGHWGHSSLGRSNLDLEGKAELFVDLPGAYELTLHPIRTSQDGRQQHYFNENFEFDIIIDKPKMGGEAQLVEIKLEEDMVEVIKELIEEAKEVLEEERDE